MQILSAIFKQWLSCYNKQKLFSDTYAEFFDVDDMLLEQLCNSYLHRNFAYCVQYLCTENEAHGRKFNG